VGGDHSLWLSGSRFGNMQPHCVDSVSTKYTSAMDKLATWFQTLYRGMAE